MTKSTKSYLLAILTLVIPNFGFYILFYFFKGLAGDIAYRKLVLNPFYIAVFILWIVILCIMLFRQDKRIKNVDRGDRQSSSSGNLEKQIVKFPTLILVYSFVYSIIAPQMMLIGSQGPFILRVDLTGLMLACILLIGMPFYIFFIRAFEESSSHVPFSGDFMSMKLSVRTLLVTFFALISLTILMYLSLKVSGRNIGLNDDQQMKIIRFAFPLVVFGILMTSVCIYLLMSGINHRIRVARSMIHTLTDGDYSREDQIILSRDEIGLLISEVNQVKNSTGKLINNISDQTDKTIEVKQNVISVAEESSSAIVEMNANIHAVGNSISHLDDNINQVSHSMGTLKNYIQDFTVRINQQVNSQEDSSAAIEEMSASIDSIAQISENRILSGQSMYGISDKGGEILQKTIQQIEKIFESLDGIKSMTQLILNIAAQTNLLAMNAAIEAAHAGEAGRGFSVVADEIRKLAENASKSSKQINNGIKDIVSLVEGATESGHETTKAFESISDGIKELLNSLLEISSGMKELKAGSNQIVHSVSDLRQSSEDLKSQSREMNQETEQVNHAVTDLKHISAEARTAMEEMGVGANEVLVSSESLNTQAADLDESSQELQLQIGKFKI